MAGVVERQVATERRQGDVSGGIFESYAFGSALLFKHEQGENGLNGASGAKRVASQSFGGHIGNALREKPCEDVCLGKVIGLRSRAVCVDEGDVVECDVRRLNGVSHGAFKACASGVWLRDVVGIGCLSEA